MKTRIVAVMAVVLLLLVVAWVWHSRSSGADDENRYNVRSLQLQSIQTERALTPSERAELDEVNRRVAKIKADKLK